MTGNVQKKGLSSISALRLLLHVHLRQQKTPSICFTTLDYYRRDSFVSFPLSAIPDTTRLCLAIHLALIYGIGPPICTLPDDCQKNNKNPMNEIREYLLPRAYRICRHRH